MGESLADDALDKRVLLIYFLVVMYAVSYQLQAPLEPFLVEKLVTDDDAAVPYARLHSFFAFVQMVGSLIVGNLIDRIGLRGAFVLNFVCCAASYALLAQATTIQGLYLSKVPTVFMAGFLCAQTAAAKLTKPGEMRVAVLGRLTMAYTVGATVGPSLGGILGVSAGAWLAVGASLFSAGLVFLLPSSVDERDQQDAPHHGSKESIADGSKGHAPQASWLARAQLVLKSVWFLLATKVISGSANNMIGSVQPLILKDVFHMNESQVGFFMSARFFGTAIVGTLLGYMTRVFGSASNLIRGCLVGMAGGYAMQAMLFSNDALLLSPNGRFLYIGIAFGLALFQFPLATTITARSTSLVPPHVKGTLVGMEHSLFAAAGMVGPAIGVGLMKGIGIAGLGGIGSFVYVLLILAWQGRFASAIELEDISGDKVKVR